MESKEKTFTLRFSLLADIPDELWQDEDFEEDAWLDEWEAGIKPALVRVVFAHLRTFPGWQARIRNRGISPADEIEIVLERTLSAPSRSGKGAG
jgi:hypothetical protein